jgi:hypothetical protein
VWLRELKLKLKAGEAPAVYTEICQAILELEAQND